MDAIFRSDIIEGILKAVPNPLAPPLLRAEIGYHPPLLPASLFKILFSKTMVLRRVSGYGDLPCELTVHGTDPTVGWTYTSGGRIEIPLNFIKLFTKGASMVPGDCSQ